MQVIETIEQEDGGAVIKLDLTPEEVDLLVSEEVDWLVSYALKDILTKKAEEVIDE